MGVLATKVVVAAIGRITRGIGTGIQAIAGQHNAVVTFIGKAAAAHRIRTLAIERPAMGDFPRQADAGDAITIEVKASTDFTGKTLVLAERLAGIKLTFAVKGKQRGCRAVVHIQLKAGEDFLDASHPGLSTGHSAVEHGAAR